MTSLILLKRQRNSEWRYQLNIDALNITLYHFNQYFLARRSLDFDLLEGHHRGYHHSRFICIWLRHFRWQTRRRR